MIPWTIVAPLAVGSMAAASAVESWREWRRGELDTGEALKGAAVWVVLCATGIASMATPWAAGGLATCIVLVEGGSAIKHYRDRRKQLNR